MTRRPIFSRRRFCAHEGAASPSDHTQRPASLAQESATVARRDTRRTIEGMYISVRILTHGADMQSIPAIGLGAQFAVHGRERIEAGTGVGAVLGRLAGVDRGRLGEVGVGSPVIDSHVIPCMIAGDFAWFCPLLHVPLHARRVSSGGGWRGEMEVRA
jgi:hypothetical protein